LLLTRRDGPREIVEHRRNEFIEMSAKRGALPTTAVVGHLEEPELDGVAAEAEMLYGVDGRARFDDEGRAILADTQMLRATLMEQPLKVRKVVRLGVRRGHLSSVEPPG
jgi:hypothetical protein